MLVGLSLILFKIRVCTIRSQFSRIFSQHNPAPLHYPTVYSCAVHYTYTLQRILKYEKKMYALMHGTVKEDVQIQNTAFAFVDFSGL